MTESAHAEEICELVKSIYKLYQRFGVSDELPFLDWSVRLSWSAPTASLDRHEEVSMDSELLHHLSWPAGRSGQIHVHLSRDEFTIQGSWSKIWPRVHDLASTRKGP